MASQNKYPRLSRTNNNYRSIGNNRSYRRKRLYYSRKPTNICKFPKAGVIPQLLIPLRYSQTITLSCTSGAVAYHQFRCNSLYDPDYTTTGTQPMLYDQLSAIWTKYCVYGCKVNAEFITPTASSPTQVTLRPSVTSSAPSDNDAEAERRWGRTAVIMKETNKAILSEYIDIGQVYGYNKSQIITDDTFTSLNTGNPLNIVYLNVVAKPLDNSTTTTVYVHLTMTFYTLFRQVYDQTPS